MLRALAASLNSVRAPGDGAELDAAVRPAIAAALGAFVAVVVLAARTASVGLAQTARLGRAYTAFCLAAFTATVRNAELSAPLSALCAVRDVATPTSAVGLAVPAVREDDSAVGREALPVNLFGRRRLDWALGTVAPRSLGGRLMRRRKGSCDAIVSTQKTET